MTVVAVDPGRRKCGLAVVSSTDGILERKVVPTETIVENLRLMLEAHQPEKVLVGGATGSKEVIHRLRTELEVEPEVVDERHTTEKARYRYFADHPPRGLWRLVPLGLQTPAVEYDDYAAVVMAEQYFEKG